MERNSFKNTHFSLTMKAQCEPTVEPKLREYSTGITNIGLSPSSLELFTNSALNITGFESARSDLVPLASVAALYIYYSLWAYCTSKWSLYFAKLKSVLCEMEICTLRNGNLYFAKMEICTLRSENLYFAKRIAYFPEKVFVKKPLRTYYSTTIMTAIKVFLSRRHRRTSSWISVDRDQRHF